MPNVLLETEAIRHRDGEFRSILTTAGFTILAPTETGRIAPADLERYLPDADAVIMGVGTLSRSIIDKATRLRAIARTGVGYDRVDVQAATDRGIAVTITPGANHESVAEHTMGLILALAREFRHHDRAIWSGLWDRSRLPAPLRGKTLGIVGLGRIGQAVARLAQAFGMKVIAYNPRAKIREKIEFVSFDEILSRSDVLSLHLPLKPETRGLFKADVFERMKPGVILINTGRGELTVEADLVVALRSGRLRAAGLEVFDSEPPRADHPLWQLDNVIMTPHLSGLDEEAVAEMGRLAACNLVNL